MVLVEIFFGALVEVVWAAVSWAFEPSRDTRNEGDE